MQLEDALNLSSKAVKLAAQVPASRALVVGKARASSALARIERESAFEPNVGFGATQAKHGWKVAVRAWTEKDIQHPATQWLIEKARGEVDVRITGVIRARAARARPPVRRGPVARGDYKSVCRPLRAGHSIAHYQVSAGTLGAWVERRKDGKLLMLSNNHVLANTNNAKRGDAIVQPGTLDDPDEEGGQVGKLEKFVSLKGHRNLVDAAVATIHREFEPGDLAIPEIGLVRGWHTAESRPEDLSGERVQKTGRTTGHRWGKIGSVTLNLPIEYGDDDSGSKILRFDRALEVHSIGKGPFSNRGDSGSLVLDRDRYAVGLLFAGDDETTYMNPIATVLDSLGVELIR